MRHNWRGRQVEYEVREVRIIAKPIKWTKEEVKGWTRKKNKIFCYDCFYKQYLCSIFAIDKCWTCTNYKLDIVCVCKQCKRKIIAMVLNFFRIFFLLVLCVCVILTSDINPTERTSTEQPTKILYAHIFMDFFIYSIRIHICIISSEPDTINKRSSEYIFWALLLAGLSRLLLADSAAYFR